MTAGPSRPLRGILRTASVWAAFVLLLGSPLPAAAGSSPSPVPDAPVTTASLRAGASGHHWEGDVAISFRNGGTGPLSEITLRLWPNGIRGCGAPLPLTVSSVTGGTAGELLVRCTALPISLSSPVAPGARGAVSMHLVVEVPERNDRFGWWRDLTFLGTPLPAIALVDADGFHLDPYTDVGESYYSAVGDYEVTLDTPDGLVTPATGVRTTLQHTGGRTVRTYMADGVRDFAWAAGPLKVRSRFDRTGVNVRAWYLPGFGGEADRALGAAVRAMDVFSSELGAFPYPEMEVVVSSFASFGGMEYPAIVFVNPNEYIVSHEIAHQWWYGIVGNDEYRAPWLDEAFASWAEDLPTHPAAAVGCGPGGWPNAHARVTNGMDYWEAHPSEYSEVVYRKGACALRALAARFGLERFIEILRGYAGDHWLGFSTTAEFQGVIEAAAATELPGWDVARFWDRRRIGPA